MLLNCINNYNLTDRLTWFFIRSGFYFYDCCIQICTKNFLFCLQTIWRQTNFYSNKYYGEVIIISCTDCVFLIFGLSMTDPSHRISEITNTSNKITASISATLLTFERILIMRPMQSKTMVNWHSHNMNATKIKTAHIFAIHIAGENLENNF